MVGLTIKEIFSMHVEYLGFNVTHLERPNCLFYNNIAILFQVRQFLDKKLQISKPISSHSAACSTCVRKYLTHTCTRARLFPFEAELLEAAGDFVNRGQWKLPGRSSEKQSHCV